MSGGSTTSRFSRANVGSSTEPCPLGYLHVLVERSDGQPLDVPACVDIAGPEEHEAGVAAGDGRWVSPKTMPGLYSGRLRYEGEFAERYQEPAPIQVALPESGDETIRIEALGFATLPVRVTRDDTGEPVAGVTLVLERDGERHEALCDSAGAGTFDRLATRGPPYRLAVEKTAPARPYQRPAARDVALQPGANPTLALQLIRLAELSLTVFDPERQPRLEIPVRARLTPAAGGSDLEAETDSASGKAVFPGLAAGSYRIAATPTRAEHRSYSIAAPEDIELGPGVSRHVELRATKGASWIRHAPSEAAATVRGSIPYSLVAAPYDEAEEKLRSLDGHEPIVIPMPDVLPFDDIRFEFERAHWSRTKESIAILGRIEAFGARRDVLFMHTYRPNRVALAIRFKDWSFVDHFARDDSQDDDERLVRYVSLHHVYLILAADNFEIESRDLPDEAASFFGQGQFAVGDDDAVADYGAEDIEVKKGVNVYGSIDVKAFPALDAVFRWLGVGDRYVNLQGYLSPDLNLALGGGKHLPYMEKTKDVAFSATVPAPIPVWGRSPDPARVPHLVKAREITLELGFKHTDAGRFPTAAKLVNRATGETKVAVRKENKFRIRVQDEVLLPFPAFALKAGNVKLVSQDVAEIKCMAALQVEGSFASWRDGDGQEVILEYTLGSTTTSMGEGDFRLAFLNEAIAVHDLRLVLNATKQTAAISGEFDLGRYDRVGALELELDLSTAPGGRDRADASAEMPKRDLRQRHREHDALKAEGDKLFSTSSEHHAEADRLREEARAVWAKADAEADANAKSGWTTKARALEAEAREAAQRGIEAGERAKAKYAEAEKALNQERASRPYTAPTDQEIAAGEKADQEDQRRRAQEKRNKERFWDHWKVTARVKPTALIAIKSLVQDALARMNPPETDGDA